MVPPALGARLDNVRSELAAALCAELAKFLLGRHAPARCRQPMTEHVGDDSQLRLLANRTVGGSLGADISSGPNQFGMSITDLGSGESTDANLVHEHPTGQAMVDDATRLDSPAERASRETHPSRVTIRQTVGMTNSTILFGKNIPDESELRLCGDISGGKRALELGLSRFGNAIAFAQLGAKSIAVDPDEAAIGVLRKAATDAEVTVECHVSDLADLGFATSGSIELVIANHTIDEVDDLGRLLRQVHRLLKASHPFVISLPHPFAGLHSTDEYGSKVDTYGTAGRTIGDWFTQLGRASFRVDQILELGVSNISPLPTTLVFRARKEGD
jgi:SAM-dependent methyltransferase